LFGLLGRIPGLGFFNPWAWMRRIAIVVVVAYLALSYTEVWTASRRDEASSKNPATADAIVVLGAAQYNGKPSPVLRGRLDHALALYERKIAPLMVVTGGRQPGDKTTEASASANYLLARGVPDTRIIREVQGRDTYQSLAAAARVLRTRGLGRRVVLVTDGFHAARVAATAEELGLVPRTSPVRSRAPTGRMLRETGAVALGRILGFRRLSAWLEQ
jgi:uncharacterized SAM-binding protein YcdF (DUF218 family)